MFREQFATGDDARLAKRRQAHGLCRIELWVLECSKPRDAIYESRRELQSVDIDLIAQHDLDRIGKLALDWWLLAATGRQRSPRLVVLFR